MQSREDELVNIQSRKDEHKQSTEDEDSTSDYEMDESYFIALQNQLRREEYLKVRYVLICMCIIMYHIIEHCVTYVAQSLGSSSFYYSTVPYSYNLYLIS